MDLYKGNYMPKYIAKQSIGHYRPGDEIKGLEDKQIQALLVSGAIEEEKAAEKTKQDGSAQQLTELAAEVAKLKAEVVKLQDALNASKPKSAKDKEQPQAQSEKAETESK